MDIFDTTRALNSRISVVVVNYNGGTQAISCVEQLLQMGEQLLEVIVVDNGSTDGSLEELQSVAHREADISLNIVANGENLGAAKARNVGIECANSDWVLLIDDDVSMAPSSLELLKQGAMATGADIIVPRLVLIPENLIQADGADIHFVGSMHLRHGRSSLRDAPIERLPIGTFSSSCLLIKRAVVLDVRGFDEAFFIYQEDMELGLRLRALGYSLVCEPQAIAFHERGAGTPSLSFRDGGVYPRQRAFLTQRNRIRMILLNYQSRTLLLLMPALVVFELASLVFTVRKGLTSTWYQAWRWQWTNRAEIRDRRRWLQTRRVVDDKQLLVGGVLPLAPGLVDSGLAWRLVKVLSYVLNGYWQFIQRWL